MFIVSSWLGEESNITDSIRVYTLSEVERLIKHCGYSIPDAIETIEKELELKHPELGLIIVAL